jgi:pimeloyl-ACP methyl ester carboxylesterase
MPIIECNSGTIDIEDAGDGVPVLCVHGSFSSAAAWRPLQKKLCPPYRVIAPNLWGCGGSSDWPSEVAPTIHLQAELVNEVMDYVGEPVHIVGHSHGGIVALASALTWPIKVRSMTLLDPLPANVLKAANETKAYAQLRQFYDDYVHAFEDGDKLAGARVVDYWTGNGTFDSLPDKFKEHIVNTTTLNLKDWQANWAYAPDASELLALSIQTLIVWGAAGNPLASSVARSLEGLMRAVSYVELTGASHMMIASHPETVADLITGHISKA